MGRRTAGGTLVQLQAFPHNDLKCQSCSGATSRGCPPSQLPNGPWALIWMVPELRRMSRANRGSSSSGRRAAVSVTGAVKETFHPSFRGEGRKRDDLQKKKNRKKKKHWLTAHLKKKKKNPPFILTLERFSWAICHPVYFPVYLLASAFRN